MGNDDATPSFSLSRKWGVGFNVALSVAALFVIVVLVNYLAARHFLRYHLAGVISQTLSSETLGVLHSLTNPVRVVVLFDRDEPLFAPVAALLKEYAEANPELVVEYVDYLRAPAAADGIKAQYHLNYTSDKDLVLFDCNKRTRIV